MLNDLWPCVNWNHCFGKVQLQPNVLLFRKSLNKSSLNYYFCFSRFYYIYKHKGPKLNKDILNHSLYPRSGGSVLMWLKKMFTGMLSKKETNQFAGHCETLVLHKKSGQNQNFVPFFYLPLPFHYTRVSITYAPAFTYQKSDELEISENTLFVQMMTHYITMNQYSQVSGILFFITWLATWKAGLQYEPVICEKLLHQLVGLMYAKAVPVLIIKYEE